MTKYVAVLAFVVAIAGCATPCTVKISSINDGTNRDAGTTYVILRSDGPEDLQFMEFASMVERALKSKNYLRIATDGDKTPDLAVFLSYKISEPQQSTSSMLVPITSYQPSETYNVDAQTSYGYGQGHTNTTGTITKAGSYVTTGYQEVTSTETFYTRQITLIAAYYKHFKATKKLTPVWQTDLISSGTTGDLRAVFPVMLAAAREQLGSNTGQQIEVDIQANDRRVSELKSTLPGPQPASAKP
jgi:hypothetical protein